MMLAGFESPTHGEIRLDGKTARRQAAASARYRHGVSELRALSAPDDRRERRVSAVGAPREPQRTEGACQARARDGRAAASRRPPAGATLGRPAAACGACPRARVRAERGADGRTAGRARQTSARNDAVRNHAAASRIVADDRLRDARPGRSADHVRPRRGVLRWPHPAGRHADRTLRKRAQRVRRELRRREQRLDGPRRRTTPAGRRSALADGSRDSRPRGRGLRNGDEAMLALRPERAHIAATPRASRRPTQQHECRTGARARNWCIAAIIIACT